MEEGDIETTKSNVNYAASLMRKGSRTTEEKGIVVWDWNIYKEEAFELGLEW